MWMDFRVGDAFIGELVANAILDVGRLMHPTYLATCVKTQSGVVHPVIEVVQR